MRMAKVRALVVEDSELWRRLIRSMLRRHSELRLVGEVSDGMAAVQEAKKLRPGLVLLDIGLPKLNGLEAQKLIHRVAPDAKVLFLTVESDAEIVKEALSSGAQGYVLKTDAESELWPAIKAVLKGNEYVSSGAAPAA